jgi:hypothetical protein
LLCTVLSRLLGATHAVGERSETCRRRKPQRDCIRKASPIGEEKTEREPLVQDVSRLTSGNL